MDISMYQLLPSSVEQGKTINWQKAWDAGIRVVAIRATVGNWYTDPVFEPNWNGAKEIGMVTTAYHVIKPSHSFQSQMDRFFSVLKDKKADIPLVLDNELQDNKSKQVITNVIQKSAQYIADKDGRNPFNYTRQSWWDINVLSWSKWNEYPLWVAWYPYDPEYPTVPKERIPRDYTTYTLWQFSADGNNQGSKYGCESKAVDLNKFNGTPEEFDVMFNTNISNGTTPPPPPPPPPSYTQEEKVDILWREAGKYGWNLEK